MAGLVGWQSVAVEHCADAHGLVLRHGSGWSLVYSGDTRPCRRLQEAGQDCTLLIHEATFEPALHQQVRCGHISHLRCCCLLMFVWSLVIILSCAYLKRCRGFVTSDGDTGGSNCMENFSKALSIPTTNVIHL